MLDNYLNIQSEFNRLLAASQQVSEELLHTDNLFLQWRAAKKNFIDAFGGELIWRSPEPVTFTLDASAKASKLDDFIEYIYNHNPLLSNFIYRNKEGFYANRVVDDTGAPSPQLKIGMKLTKAFKFFEGSDRLLDAFQTRASMLLQENKVTGYLYLSVHPLDFLTLSENRSGWRSCHALDGDYRAGNLAYMVDKATVICYLAGEDKVSTPNSHSDFKWNNKKWRVLVYVSNSMRHIFLGRQYPFNTEGSLTHIKSAITKTIWYKWENYLSNPYWPGIHGWYNDYINNHYFNLKQKEEYVMPFLNGRYVPLDNKLHQMTELFPNSNINSALAYNDVINSSYYHDPYYMWASLPGYMEKNYSDVTFDACAPKEKVPCIVCGENHLFASSSMMCEKCELAHGHCNDEDYFCYCEVCGHRMLIDSEEPIRLYGGEILCESCANSVAAQCDCCGDWFYEDEMHYHRKDDACYCSYCYENKEDVDD